MRTRRKKGIVELYGYYEKDIHTLAINQFNGWGTTIKDIGMTSGRIQAAYKEMKEASFGGTIIEYLSWVAFRYWLKQNLDRGELSGEGMPPGIFMILWNPGYLIQSPEFDEYARKAGGDRTQAENDFIRKVAELLGGALIAHLDTIGGRSSLPRP